MTEIIANKIRDIVDAFKEDKDIDMEAYIDTLALAVAQQLLNEVLMRNEPDSTKGCLRLWPQWLRLSGRRKQPHHLALFL